MGIVVGGRLVVRVKMIKNREGVAVCPQLFSWPFLLSVKETQLAKMITEYHCWMQHPRAYLILACRSETWQRVCEMLSQLCLLGFSVQQRARPTEQRGRAPIYLFMISVSILPTPRGSTDNPSGLSTPAVFKC